MAARRSRNDRGASAVEFALILPFLAMVLFGIIGVALGYNDKLALANAVREGARVGATLPNSTSWAGSVQSQVTTAFAGDTTGVSVCAKLLKPDGTVVRSAGSSCGAEPTAPASATSCYVMVWASKPGTLDWLLGRGTYSVQAQSVAVYDRSQSCP